jgi:hypothetical protein
MSGCWNRLMPLRWKRTSWLAHRTRNSSLRVDSWPTRSESPLSYRFRPASHADSHQSVPRFRAFVLAETAAVRCSLEFAVLRRGGELARGLDELTGRSSRAQLGLRSSDDPQSVDEHLTHVGPGHPLSVAPGRVCRTRPMSFRSADRLPINDPDTKER